MSLALYGVDLTISDAVLPLQEKVACPRHVRVNVAVARSPAPGDSGGSASLTGQTSTPS